ncbi:PAS domain S-box protein [Methanolacinia petrolearia]|uniref:PAS domain S-box protein n=1 Tax=Methanolacinia petrolearia TaxID=54120 RepID=UPI003BABFDC3
MSEREDRYATIREFLQEKYPEAVSISTISRQLNMNRGSVAKYLEVLQSHGNVIMKPYGKSKLYSIAQNVAFDDLFNYISDAIVILDADLHILMVNKSFIETFNIRSGKKIIGNELSRINLALLDNPTVLENIDRILNSRVFINEMLLIERGTDRIFLTEFVSTVIPSISFTGKPGIMISLRDITTWKKTEEALKSSEQKIRTLFEEVPSGIILFREDGTILNAKRASLDILGLTRFTDLEEFKLHDIMCSREIIQNLIRQGEIAELTLSCNFDRLKSHTLTSTKKSGIAYFQIVFAHVTDKTGKSSSEFFILFLDITAKKIAEKQLKERYQGTVNNLPGIVYQFYARDSGEWGVYYVNERTQEIYGVPTEPLKNWFDRYGECIAPEDQERWFDSIHDVIKRVAPWEFEGRFIKPSGEEMYIRVLSQPVRLRNETVWNGIILDITDRRKAEEALRRTELKEASYHSFFENTCNGVLIYEPLENGDHIIKDVNKMTASLLRMDKEDIVGKRLFEEFPDLPDPYVRDLLHRVLITEKPEFVAPLKYRNREEFPWISHYGFKLPSGEIASFMIDVTDVVKDDPKPAKRKAK